MENILACIVTYNPSIDILKKNIENILIQTNNVVIIDNNSNNKVELFELINNINARYHAYRIELIQNDDNNGIAQALNQGLSYSKANNYEWILTLDQDSICDKNMIKVMKNYCLKINNSKIGIISPNVIDENKGGPVEVMNNEVEYPTVAITSGSLINVKIGIKIGGFLEKLFIDYVDHEFCLRLRLKGYEIIKLKDAKIYHTLGDIKVKSILGLKLTTTNHSALRRYYYFRNSIYVHKKYYKYYRRWCNKDIMRELRVLVGIVLFEKDKINKLKNIYMGINDGLKSKYGKFIDQ